jgi:hypothetical protein
MIEVIQSVHEEHIYIDKKGTKWIREFTVPNMNMDTKISPFDDKKHQEKIKNTKGTLGGMYDYAKEQSDRRAQVVGDIDPKKKENWAKYEKTRGKKCLEERKHTLQKNLKEAVVKVKKKLS